MKKLAFLSIVLVLFACNKSDSLDPDKNVLGDLSTVPNCIQDIIDDVDLSASLKTLRVQELDNEFHYWLNTDFMQADGREFIVTAACDTICSFCGFCLPAACASDYDDDNWTTIWED